MSGPIPDATVPRTERHDRVAITSRQGRRLAELLAAIYGPNLFYTRKIDDSNLGSRFRSLRFPDDLAALPLTTKAELVVDQEAHPPWGTVLTEPIDRYTRYNQTSSTTGRPLRWVDTNESWQWMLECWKAVYRAARVDQSDRILFAFSFGPFLGFWTAFDAACQIGAHAVPAGGMSSQQRLALIDALAPSVVCCTPTYALRLAEVAAAERQGARPLSACGVRAVIVAGEPGGCIPSTRERIEQSWGARVIDQHGLTEVGPVSFECWEGPGAMHVNENEFMCEVLDPATTDPVPDGQPGELVLTNLGRTASPVIRYRTGDVVVRRSEPCACGRTFARLDGGILARTDDMVNIRGVNVYPTAIESVVRRFPQIVEFRSTVSHAGALLRLTVDIELAPMADDPGSMTTELARRLREALGLNVPVQVVAAGSLPRFEMKARRFVVKTCTAVGSLERVMSDVVVIGGGPAGSTVSTLLAQKGVSVELFERDRFPRFHIGESLIPETYWVLKRLNMLPKMQRSHFVKKYSVQFVNANGKLSAPFYFWDNKPHECSQTWQVVRSEFDQMMLDNAREHGVAVYEGARVLDLLWDRDRAVGITVRGQDGSVREVRATVVVDASGQAGLIQNRLRLRVWDPILNKGAIWTYWEGAYRDTGRDEGATMVLQTASKNGWFWYIPQHNNIVSVGVVAPFDYLFKNRENPGDYERTYGEEVDRCVAVKERVSPGRRVAGYFATKDYSYRATKVAGDGWVMIGDAWGFLDPLYSSGVLLALKSGEMAADAIVEGLAAGDTSAAQLEKWGPKFNRGVDRMRRLVCEYYDGFSFGNFVRQYPELQGTVTDLLIGDLFTDRVDKVWKPMESLYPSDKSAIPAWDAGTPAETAANKLNELKLPEGWKP